MGITLDTAIEQRLEQQLANGRFRGPTELLTHALDLIEAEEDIQARRRALLDRLEQSCAQADRSEGYTEDQLRERMVALRAGHHFARTA